MAGTNNFLPFATGSSPNVINDATYNGLTARGTGFQSGVAQSQQLNKVWRQSSVMAAVLGQLIADRGNDANDSDTIANLEAYLKAALMGSFQTVSYYSADQTLNAKQAGSHVYATGVANITITLPSASSVGAGGAFSFYNAMPSNTMTIARAGSDVLPTGSSTVLSPGDTLYITSNGSSNWELVGGSAAMAYSTSFNNPTFTGNVAYQGTLTGGTGVVNIGSGQIYKDASGNVSIGNTSPSTYGKLVVESGRAYVRGSAAANQGEIDLQNTDSGGATWRIGDAISTPAGDLAIYRGGTGLGASIDSSLNFKFNSGFGSVAKAYGCRAWVNFDGTTLGIRSSGNVSSIGRNGTGDFNVNFSTAMPDASYATNVTSGTASNSGWSFAGGLYGTGAYSTTSVRVNCIAKQNGSFQNDALMCVTATR